MVENAGHSAFETGIKNALIKYSKTNNNLIITPHIGGYGRESVKRTREYVTNLFLKNHLCDP